MGAIGIFIILLCLMGIVEAIVSGYDNMDSKEFEKKNTSVDEKIINNLKVDDPKHIPEFSSIALPIAIIIGILFIYTSHKET